MFETLQQEGPWTAGRRVTSLFVSLVVHGVLVAVIVVLPLVFFNVLHADELVTFLIQPPHRLPETPAAPTPPVRTAPTGIAVVRTPLDPVPHTLPFGIPAPDESDEPPVFAGLTDGIGLPHGVAARGTGISELVGKNPVVEVPVPQPPAPRTPVRVSSGVQESKLLVRVAPDYPVIAAQAQASGRVLLEAEIDEEGNVAKVNVVSGHPLLVNAAVQAVKQWKYSPTVLNGEPQRILANVTVIFRLKR